MSDSKECKFKVGDKVVPFPTKDGYVSNYLVEDSIYTITKIHENGRVDMDGTFNYNGNGRDWYSGWFKHYEEKEVKVENTLTAESLRNSILSLQQERVSLQEKIEQNIVREKALTDQLKGLGFLLVESKEQPTNVVDEKKAVLYAEDIAENMFDPRNWKSGDVLEVIKNNSDLGYRLRTKVKVIKTRENYIEFQFEDEYNVRHQWLNSQGADFMKEYFKFHSRPVTN